jgi:hypothetical protein
MLAKLVCVLTLLLSFSLLASPLFGQTNCNVVLGLSAMKPIEIPSARLQDSLETTAQIRILKLGKSAIPSLIDCLTDEHKTKKPVFQFWVETKVGDIAFAFLNDLFRDRSLGRQTIDGVITQSQVHDEFPEEMSGAALQLYVAKHGRLSIQRSWQKKWAEIKDRAIWDKSERCFRVTGVIE